MNKTIDFELNKFSTTPHKLRNIPSIDTPGKVFVIDLSRLFHHYYTDFWGVTPIDPDHTNFEYLRFLDSCSDFRFLNSKVSVSEAHKRTISYTLGQAFCRYFLYEFCGITYFAQMDKVLNKGGHPAFDGLRIQRIKSGDVPDYLCAKSVAKPFIGEAKGRFSNISFSSVEFGKWRDQFTRIEVVEKTGIRKRVKGYIVATKYSTDKNPSANKSKLFAEDPETLGEENLSENVLGIGRGCIAVHYSRLVSKLGLNLLSLSLEEGFVVPQELQFNLPIWKCNYPPLNDETFVGGFLSETEPSFQRLENGNAIFYPNILKLDNPSPSFYGIRASTFRLLRKVCLGNWNLLSEIPLMDDTDFRPSNLSWLRDGSISGALDFFELVGTETF